MILLTIPGTTFFGTKYFEKAFSRSLELLDLTLSDDRWKGARRREIARARDQVCEVLTEYNDAEALKSLNEYFYRFALLSRKST